MRWFVVMVLAVGASSDDDVTLCGYDNCKDYDPNVLNVHIVAHTRDEVGWLKAFDDRFAYKTRSNLVENAHQQFILDSVVDQLFSRPDRKFTHVESAFFWKWWYHQPESVRKKVATLVRLGRLEFAGGSVAVNDEANTHYQSIIDHFTWGVKSLEKIFGICGRPLAGWQVETSGHSREFANLLAAMGYDGLFLGKIDYQDRRRRMEDREMEMIWRGEDALGKSSDIFTSIVYSNDPPLDACTSVLCWIQTASNDTTTSDELSMKLQDFVKYLQDQSLHYRTNNILVAMGKPLAYQNLASWFATLDSVIEKINKWSQKFDKKLKVYYSTPNCYLKAVQTANPILPVKQDDFFPYAGDTESYWGAFYSGRPTIKFLEREANRHLQMIKQLQLLANLKESQDVEELKTAMGIIQHHTAITGTAPEEISSDYMRLLSSTLDKALRIGAQGINKFMHGDAVQMRFNFKRCLLNESSCPVSETSRQFIVSVYNPLGWNVTEVVRIPVTYGNYQVYSPIGDQVEVQLMVIPTAVTKIRNRSSVATHELFFIAHLLPVSFQTFYVRKIQRTRRYINPRNDDEENFGNYDTDHFGNHEKGHIEKNFRNNVKENFRNYDDNINYDTENYRIDTENIGARKENLRNEQYSFWDNPYDIATIQTNNFNLEAQPEIKIENEGNKFAFSSDDLQPKHEQNNEAAYVKPVDNILSNHIIAHNDRSSEIDIQKLIYDFGMAKFQPNNDKNDEMLAKPKNILNVDMQPISNQNNNLTYSKTISDYYTSEFKQVNKGNNKPILQFTNGVERNKKKKNKVMYLKSSDLLTGGLLHNNDFDINNKVTVRKPVSYSYTDEIKQNIENNNKLKFLDPFSYHKTDELLLNDVRDHHTEEKPTIVADRDKVITFTNHMEPKDDQTDVTLEKLMIDLNPSKREPYYDTNTVLYQEPIDFADVKPIYKRNDQENLEGTDHAKIDSLDDNSVAKSRPISDSYMAEMFPFIRQNDLVATQQPLYTENFGKPIYSNDPLGMNVFPVQKTIKDPAEINSDIGNSIARMRPIDSYMVEMFHFSNQNDLATTQKPIEKLEEPVNNIRSYEMEPINVYPIQKAMSDQVETNSVNDNSIDNLRPVDDTYMGKMLPYIEQIDVVTTQKPVFHDVYINNERTNNSYKEVAYVKALSDDKIDLPVFERIDVVTVSHLVNETPAVDFYNSDKSIPIKISNSNNMAEFQPTNNDNYPHTFENSSSNFETQPNNIKKQHDNDVFYIKNHVSNRSVEFPQRNRRYKEIDLQNNVNMAAKTQSEEIKNDEVGLFEPASKIDKAKEPLTLTGLSINDFPLSVFENGMPLQKLFTNIQVTEKQPLKDLSYVGTSKKKHDSNPNVTDIQSIKVIDTLQKTIIVDKDMSDKIQEITEKVLTNPVDHDIEETQPIIIHNTKEIENITEMKNNIMEHDKTQDMPEKAFPQVLLVYGSTEKNSETDKPTELLDKYDKAEMNTSIQDENTQSQKKYDTSIIETNKTINEPDVHQENVANLVQYLIPEETTPPTEFNFENILDYESFKTENNKESISSMIDSAASSSTVKPQYYDAEPKPANTNIDENLTTTEKGEYIHFGVEDKPVNDISNNTANEAVDNYFSEGNDLQESNNLEMKPVDFYPVEIPMYNHINERGVTNFNVITTEDSTTNVENDANKIKKNIEVKTKGNPYNSNTKTKYTDTKYAGEERSEEMKLNRNETNALRSLIKLLVDTKFKDLKHTTEDAVVARNDDIKNKNILDPGIEPYRDSELNLQNDNTGETNEYQPTQERFKRFIHIFKKRRPLTDRNRNKGDVAVPQGENVNTEFSIVYADDHGDDMKENIIPIPFDDLEEGAGSLPLRTIAVKTEVKSELKTGLNQNEKSDVILKDSNETDENSDENILKEEDKDLAKAFEKDYDSIFDNTNFLGIDNDKSGHWERLNTNESFLANEDYKIHMSANGQLERITLRDDFDIEFQVQFYYYEVTEDKSIRHQYSGSHSFRPNQATPKLLTINYTKASSGPIVKEIRTSFRGNVHNTIRLYKGKNFIETEWMVGPIDVSDNIGKEYIIKYETNLNNEGVFYTDCNGRQSLKRILNKRPQWNVTLDDPVAGNYYPITNKIHISNGKHKLAVITDRASGGSSLAAGEIEIMLHRRHDDGIKIEPRNDESNEDLVVTGKHRVIISSDNTRKHRLREKKQVIENHLKPIILVADATGVTFRQWMNMINIQYSWLKNLPEGVHLLSLEPWGDGTLLLRLENYMEIGDKDVTTVRVNLKKLFTTIKVKAFKETLLAANAWSADDEKWSWRKERMFSTSFNEEYGRDDTEKSTDEEEDAHDEGYELYLKAKQIRTFVIEFENK